MVRPAVLVALLAFVSACAGEYDWEHYCDPSANCLSTTSIGSKCNGIKNCCDGTDEDPSECLKIKTAIPLEEDVEFVFEIVDFDFRYDALVLVVCNGDDCGALTLSENNLVHTIYDYPFVDRYNMEKGLNGKIRAFEYSTNGLKFSSAWAVKKNGPVVKFWLRANPSKIFSITADASVNTLYVSSRSRSPMTVNAYENAVTGLSLGSFQMINVEFDKTEQSGVVFDICDEKSCDRFAMKGISKKNAELVVEKYSAVPESSSYFEYNTLFKSMGDVKPFHGELIFIVNRTMFCSTPTDYSNPAEGIRPIDSGFGYRPCLGGDDTVHLSLFGVSASVVRFPLTVEKSSTLTVRRRRSKVETTHLAVIDIPYLMSRLNATIYSQPNRDKVDRVSLRTILDLAAIRGSRGNGEEAERAVRWMSLAANSLPLPANSTTLPLATDIVGYVDGARLDASYAKDLQDDFVKQHLHDRGTSYSDELARKISSTRTLLHDHILPSIKTLDTTLQKELSDLQKRVSNATSTIEADQDEIKEIEKKKAALNIFRVLGAVFSFLGDTLSESPEPDTKALGVASTIIGDFTKSALAWFDGPLDKEIEKLKKEIQENASFLEAFGPVLPLLDASLRLSKELAAAKGSSVDIRAWLSSPGIIEFKTQLVLLAPQNVGAAVSGMNLFDLFTDVGHNVVDAMDKVEEYTTQRVIVDLVTPQLDSVIDSERYRPGLQAMRSIVSENTVITDHRTTSRSLQLYAYPFCSSVGYSSAEKCMAGRSIAGLVKCAVGSYANTLGVLRKQKSSIYEKGRRSADFVVEDDRDNSFVIWPRAKYASLISDLLSGKTIQVHTDVVREGHTNIYAVKFHVVGIQFWHADPAVRSEIEAALGKFTLSMTHMGNSYFKCNSDVVAFSHRVVNIEYSFRKNSKGQPEEYNEEYQKLRDGNGLLSPYALWSIQLKPLESTQANFEALKKFESLVDMALVGEATYLKEDASCDGCMWDFVAHKGHSSGGGISPFAVQSQNVHATSGRVFKKH